MMIKKLLSFLLCVITASVFMTGCGKEAELSADISSLNVESTTAAPENVEIMNYTEPEIGDNIIEMTIKDYGTVKFRLFPEYADKGVENFIGLANKGFYDGLSFNRIINNLMVQSGDPNGDGTGGESMWGGSFDGGTDAHLINVSGAVGYINSGSTDSDNSQFYIVTGVNCTDNDFSYLADYGYAFSDNAKEAYKQYGGYPTLDGSTVFGQVIDGLDVIYQLQYEATSYMGTPLNDVTIDTVRVNTYNGEKIKWHIDDYDYDDPASHDVANYTAPEIGDKIVKMNIKDFGTVTFRLFPEYLPQASDNFLQLAESGYYDGLTFHRVISDFMIQGGDPNGDGTGGASINGVKFDGGTYYNLVHVAGALAYANSGSTATNGSQFYIVTGSECSDEYFSQLTASGYSFTDKAIEAYKSAGYGTPFLDGNYTVFGQVIDGLDVVFEVQNVETDTTNDMPVDKVIIESVTVEEYDGSEIKWYISDYDNTNASEEEDTETSTEENAEESTEETTENTAE